MVSPSTDRRYPLTLICSVFRTARSSVYAAVAMGGGGAAVEGRVLEKRGPKTTHSDAELLEEIRTVLEESSFLSEGHRKVWAMLRRKGIRVGRNRVLRLMRENRLLAPVRRVHQRGDRTHSGTIRTEHPDELWGTDATRFYTVQEGWCLYFGAIDVCMAVDVLHLVVTMGSRCA